ncbi:TIGR03915 family putative DNA repair protein [Tanticharoenia sakaeratensis]|uniref:Uracil DNA glycosylase n=1 Tax=Tanticharoenia sakaeratensis NBRC 103193 TaxID=1231623 RepID=A0A0D6MQT8_9PROT|nr:TIGR03915 family putative DNA repair protein [Tanticharoenia sakaeratensis]GAN55750.1 uracil DNA glycosylase [Tanticharoenia sakaeratensis NBRC 103193]GBQ18532.1 uracil-DNA glycosylase [Tanticharoenia sakaeratensis NBRC 103193]
MTRFRARVSADGDSACWRTLARRALRAGIAPERLDWIEDGKDDDLFPVDAPWPEEDPARAPVLSRAALTLIETALCHSDPVRHDLAYRLVWRLQDEAGLLAVSTDADVARLRRMAQAVRRDSHKMTAFVRFREQPGCNGRRRFCAWFEPDHHILRRVAPFFANRFTDMDWLIATPRGSIAWDGETLDVRSGAFTRPELADDLDQLWRTYYGATFNPARVKIQAMKSEMPRKYWRNLPETNDIPALLAGADARVRRMAAQQAAPAPAFHHSLRKRLPRVPEDRD